jgi:hypothetical protein
MASHMSVYCSGFCQSLRVKMCAWLLELLCLTFSSCVSVHQRVDLERARHSHGCRDEQTDPDTLKLLPTLCKRITGTDCWIRMTSQFVQDASTTAVVAIADDPSLPSANRAGSVSLDTTSSVLENFNLNMNTAVLTLTFDEPIHPLTLRPTAIKLAFDGSGAPTALHTLTGSTIQTATYGIVVSLLLAVADMVKIKVFGTFAASAQTT